MADLGYASYDEHEFGAQWWLERAQDAAHTRAYKRIAETAAEHAPIGTTKRVIDYACGPGLLMRYLLRVFPKAEILGLDESEACLDAIERVLMRSQVGKASKRVRSERVGLPADDALPTSDVAIFCFPDFRGAENHSRLKKLKKRHPKEWAASKAMRKWLNKTFSDGYVPPAAEVFLKRLAHREMITAVGRKGVVLRVDYANCLREECDDVYDLTMAFYEGSLKKKQAPAELREHVRPFSRLLANDYRRSGVMADVYAQTGDIDDLQGGYLISVLRSR